MDTIFMSQMVWGQAAGGQAFGALIALSLIGLVIWTVTRYVAVVRGGPRYHRSKTRRLKGGKYEFKIVEIDSFDAVEDFLAFVSDRYGLEVAKQDQEPDDMFWRLERRAKKRNPVFRVGGTTTKDTEASGDWIDFFYDDHDGARIRSRDNRVIGLFRQLERDFAR